jgi:hypothetical protein
VIASAVATHDTLMASGLKTVPGTSDPIAVRGPPSSKTNGGTSSSKSFNGALGFKVTGGGLVSKGLAGLKKVAAHIKKHCDSLTGPMAGASLEESQDSSPLDRTIQIVAPKIPLRSEPHGQSPPALVLRPNPPAALQTTSPFGAGGASTGFCRLSAIAFVCVAK